ncbi:MAG: hypothetical protein D6830_00015 [Ignavibacteria bacterium]|nr:MAG: hypothetical protein D6830_00015 [Ignavibacteria bacterium]
MKKCKCGNDRNSKQVNHKCHYSGFGWFLFSILGMSAKPVRVDFTCNNCGETFEKCTDPQVLKQYAGR